MRLVLGCSAGISAWAAAGYSMASPHPPQMTRTIDPSEPSRRWISKPSPHSS